MSLGLLGSYLSSSDEGEEETSDKEEESITLDQKPEGKSQIYIIMLIFS